jgi:hypothetical protein
MSTFFAQKGWKEVGREYESKFGRIQAYFTPQRLLYTLYEYNEIPKEILDKLSHLPNVKVSEKRWGFFEEDMEYGKGRRERKEYTFGKKMEIEVNLRKLKESETKELLKKLKISWKLAIQNLQFKNNLKI